MNISQVVLLTFGCLLGLLVTGYNAQYQYLPVGTGAGFGGAGAGFGGSSFLYFFLFFFLIFFLFFGQGKQATSVSVVNLTSGTVG